MPTLRMPAWLVPGEGSGPGFHSHPHLAEISLLGRERHWTNPAAQLFCCHTGAAAGCWKAPGKHPAELDQLRLGIVV